MNVDEPGLPADFVVAIGHGDDDALVQALDELDLRMVHNGVKEADFKGTWIGEEILDPGGAGLGDEELSPRTGHGCFRGDGKIARGKLHRFERLEDGSRCRGREA